MRFYLGIHHPSQRWFDLAVPVFVSTRTLKRRKSFPTPRTWWALDSGGFTELNLFGRFETSAREYAADVDRYIEGGMTRCAFVSPQDWMCEPFVLEKTGLTVAEHQRRTVYNYLDLRERLGGSVIPVVQGWVRDDYLRCVDLYEAEGVDLERETLVGVGSVCRRSNTAEGAVIFRALHALGLSLHGYGVKIDGLTSFSDALSSADSMAWSYDGRRAKKPCPYGNKSCANCLHHALAWRLGVMNRLGQQRLEVAA